MKVFTINHIKVVAVVQPAAELGCRKCAFYNAHHCTISWDQEREQGANCVADNTYYELANE